MGDCPFEGAIPTSEISFSNRSLSHNVFSSFKVQKEIFEHTTEMCYTCPDANCVEYLTKLEKPNIGMWLNVSNATTWVSVPIVKTLITDYTTLKITVFTIGGIFVAFCIIYVIVAYIKF